MINKISVILLFISTSAFAQTKNPSLPGKTDVFQNISAFKSLKITDATSVFINEPVRGGNFNLYTGTDPVDDGMIFKDANQNKWKRVTADHKIDVRWYGAKSYAAGKHDSRSAIVAARDYIYAHKNFTTLYMPVDDSGWYYSSDSILFHKNINILGDGYIGYPQTHIYFAAHTTGFVFQYVSGENGFAAEMRNIRITGTWDGTFDVSKHAIVSRVYTKIYNVLVDSYDGDGLHISACATPPFGENNNYGNADHSSIEYFTAKYCTNGIFIEGCDANTINITNSNTNQMRRWGIYDNGMLGNLYVKPHAAFNGTPRIKGANSVVSFKGLYYTAKPAHDGYWPNDIADSNVNKQPDINPDYWYQVTKMTALEWDSNTRYYSGGPIAIINANARTSILNSYTEAFQPPIWLNYRSKVDGGDNGAAVTNGSWHQVYAAKDYFFNANQVFPNHRSAQHLLTIGKNSIDNEAVITVFNDHTLAPNTFIGLKSESSSATVYNKLKTNRSEAQYGLADSDFRTYINSELLTVINKKEFRPESDDHINLGSSGKRWKDVYAGSFHGDGSNLTNISKRLVYNEQTGTSYTLRPADLGLTITFKNNGPVLLTVPPGLPEGFTCTIIQIGKGVVTIKGSGTTIDNAESFNRTGGQYTATTLLMYSNDKFITQGKMQK